jgi:tetratricopeptide (TPR) repeat protein
MVQTAFPTSLRACLAACAFFGGMAFTQSASALDMIIGGQAELCSKAAKAGVASNDALGWCTSAILGEPLSPKDLAGTYVNRGTLFLVRESWQAALDDFDTALAKMPTLPEAIVNRGAAFLGMGRYAEAIDEITRGIALNPEEPEKAYANRAAARWRLDDVKGAYVDFLKAQALNPTWELPREQLTHFVVQPAPVENQGPAPALNSPGRPVAPRS